MKSKKHSLISIAESNKRQYRLSHGRISFLSARSWKPFSAAQPWSGLSFQRNLLRLCVKEKSVSNRRGRSVHRAPVSHRALPALHWQSLTGCLTLFHLLQSCARSAMPSVAQSQPVGRISPSAPCSAPLDPASPSCSSSSPPKSCWGWRWTNCFSPCFVSFEKLRFPTSSASRSLGRAKAVHVQSFLPAFLNLKFQRTLQCAN